MARAVPKYGGKGTKNIRQNEKNMVKNNVKSGNSGVFESGTTTTNEEKVIPGHEKFAFVRGLNRVPMMNVVAVKNEICEALGIVNRTTFYKRLYGTIEPKVSEAETINRIFAKYGVKDVWGVEA